MKFQTIFAATAIVILLGGCSHRGDFGRTEPSFFEDRVLPVTRSLVGRARGEVVSDYPLTADEKRLRTVSRSLADPEKRSTLKKTVLRQVHEAGIAKNKYEQKRRHRHDIGLEAADYRSPYKQNYALLYAVKNDVRLTERFIDTSRAVYKTDNIRYRRLNSFSDLSGEEVRNVTGRLKDNREIVEATLLVLENRVSDYRLDLQHMKLREPGPLEREIAYAIDSLDIQSRKLHAKTSYWAKQQVAAKQLRRRTY
jgi:hypothetical protein